MRLFVKAFCFLKVVSWVARDDRASGRPCCGTCFPSWDPNTLVVLKEEFFDPGHSFAMKPLCPCLSSQNFPDVTRQDFPGKKYLFIWALIAHLLHPPPSYTQCGQIFHFLKSFKQKKCRNKKMSKSGRFEQCPRERVFFSLKTVVKCIIFVSNEASARR